MVACKKKTKTKRGKEDSKGENLSSYLSPKMQVILVYYYL